MAGYWAARQRFGNKNISWRRLIQPTIDMARAGITVSRTKAEKLRVYQFNQTKMREIFINPGTGEPWLEGDVYTRPDLADTLDLLATAGDRGEENLGIVETKNIFLKKSTGLVFKINGKFHIFFVP